MDLLQVHATRLLMRSGMEQWPYLVLPKWGPSGPFFDHLNSLLKLKLKKIFDRVLSLIDDYNPDEVALEAPFYGKNVQSMLKLGRAQGVAMAAALSREIPITEYAPKKVKQSVTSNGNASKAIYKRF